MIVLTNIPSILSHCGQGKPCYNSERMEMILTWILIAIQAIVPLVHAFTAYISDDVGAVVRQAQEKIVDVATSSSPLLPAATSVAAVVHEKASLLGKTASRVVRQATPGTDTAISTITDAQVLAYTNIERSKAGLPLLAGDATLVGIAQKKARDMIDRDYFAHESPDGKTIGDLAKAVGYDYLSVGENLALGDFADAEKLVDAWMNSPGHRANILSSVYTQIGIAVVRGTINGHESWVAVQEFGVPQSVCPAPDAATRSRLETLQGQIKTLDAKLTQQDRTIDNLSRADPDRAALIAQYNNAVNARNELATRYRTDAKQYNQQVGSFNDCLSTALKK